MHDNQEARTIPSKSPLDVCAWSSPECLTVGSVSWYTQQAERSPTCSPTKGSPHQPPMHAHAHPRTASFITSIPAPHCARSPAWARGRLPLPPAVSIHLEGHAAAGLQATQPHGPAVQRAVTSTAQSGTARSAEGNM